MFFDHANIEIWLADTRIQTWQRREVSRELNNNSGWIITTSLTDTIFILEFYSP